MEILRVDSLTLRFGELAAVNDLSFELEQGEVFGVAGPNGAGKSTLFNAITGFYRYTGDIYFESHRITGLRPHQICQKGIARTFQICQPFSTLSVYDNLRIGAHFGAGLRGAKRRRDIVDMMDFVGLGGKEDVCSANLSLFDKKLTMFAAALLTKPRLVLVDEPTAGLSPTETTEFVALFKKINLSLGITMIIIEHLMKVLTELSQRMLVMENGKKITVGTPTEVCEDKKVIEIYLGRGKHA